ncbi:hypothetical protein ACFE04_024466 [Oxalis oulophora]
MATTPVSEPNDGPVLNVINKRLRALKKKLNRINQMEESIAQGKSLNQEQQQVFKSKPSLLTLIDELDKLRLPLATAVYEEINQQRPNPNNDDDDDRLEDLLNVIYLASLFDVKSQTDFAATMWTRIHERGCCLAYDYVTDEPTDLLAEKDLDCISKLGGLLISRPANSVVSHKNALESCIRHAKLWVANSQQPIDTDNADDHVTYAGLREKLKKIMGSDYFTLTPQIQPPVQMTAAAGNYVAFQVPVQSPVVPVSVAVDDDSVAQYEHKDEKTVEFEKQEAGDIQASPEEEIQKVEALQPEETVSETVSIQTDELKLKENQLEGDVEQNNRENGRQQNYDQPGNHYPRNSYNQGRGGGGPAYNNHGAGAQGGYTQADVGVGS